MSEPATEPVPEWVLSATLNRPYLAREGDNGLTVDGVLLLDSSAPAEADASLVVGGIAMPARWQRPSPKLAARFPETPEAARAKFVAGSVPANGESLDLVLTLDGQRHILASRSLPDTLPGVRIRGGAAAVRDRIAALAAAHQREEPDRVALRDALAQVPAAKRDREWREAKVLSQILFRNNPKQMLAELAEIRADYQSKGDASGLADFWDQVTAALGGLTLTPHGYRRPLGGAADSGQLWAAIATVTDTLAAAGFPSFVVSGTLLGLIREGDLIPHDDDIDLAVIIEGATTYEVVPNWQRLRALLPTLGLSALDQTETPLAHLQIELAPGVKADLFPAWFFGNNAFVYPHTAGELTVDDLLPLAVHEVHGARVPVPKNPQALLRTNYGDDWGTPDPTFRFDWARSRQRFGDLVERLKPRSDKRVYGFVLHHTMARPTRPDAESGLEVTGSMLPDPRVQGLTPELLVDGEPVPADWGLPTPGLARSFPQIQAAPTAGFQARDLPTNAQLLRLVARAEDRTILLNSHRLPAVLPSPSIHGGMAAVSAFLDDLASHRDRDPADYLALDEALRRVPRRLRDQQWLETKIRTDAFYSMRAKATVAALSDLRGRFERAGDGAGWERFWTDLSAAIDPLTITIHGYNLALRHQSGERVWAEVSEVITALSDLGLSAGVTAGTLLGLIREGGLIGHDDDVDLAVYLPVDDHHCAAEAWLSAREAMREAGLLDPEFEAFDRPHARLVQRGAVQIDVFPAWTHEGRYYMWPHVFGDTSADEVFPLGAREVHGVQMPVPCQPEAALAAAYGAGWAVPDPAYNFSWGAAKQRFEAVLDRFRPSWVSPMKPDQPARSSRP